MCLVSETQGNDPNHKCRLPVGEPSCLLERSAAPQPALSSHLHFFCRLKISLRTRSCSWTCFTSSKSQRSGSCKGPALWERCEKGWWEFELRNVFSSLHYEELWGAEVLRDFISSRLTFQYVSDFSTLNSEVTGEEPHFCLFHKNLILLVPLKCCSVMKSGVIKAALINQLITPKP